MAATKSSITRRRALAGTVGLAGSLAMNVGQAKDNEHPQPSYNPLAKYPAPPFKRQSQPWPGLASRMDPPPDHGERTYRGSGRLAGRKALITGGDSGMGRAAAIAYAREGALVAINYFPFEESDAQEVISYIKAEGRTGVAIPGDLRDERFCTKLVEDALQGLGGLDVIVSNAARHEDFDATMKTNIYAPFWIIKSAPPASQTRRLHRRNHIRAGIRSFGGVIRLCADQGGNHELREVTRKAARPPKGIRVNGVAPGPIWTPLQVSGGATMEKLEKFRGQTVFKRPGQPAELASIYVQLASADATFATGQIYGSSGGNGQP